MRLMVLVYNTNVRGLFNSLLEALLLVLQPPTRIFPERHGKQTPLQPDPFKTENLLPVPTRFYIVGESRQQLWRLIEASCGAFCWLTPCVDAAAVSPGSPHLLCSKETRKKQEDFNRLLLTTSLFISRGSQSGERDDLE